MALNEDRILIIKKVAAADDCAWFLEVGICPLKVVRDEDLNF